MGKIPPEHEPRPHPSNNTIAVERLTHLVQVLSEANLKKTGHFDHYTGQILLYETVEEVDLPQVQAGTILQVTRYWGRYSGTQCQLKVTTDRVSWTPDTEVTWPSWSKYEKLHQMYLEQQSTTFAKYEADGPNYSAQLILGTNEQQLYWNPSSLGTLQRMKYTNIEKKVVDSKYRDDIFSDAHHTLQPIIQDLTNGLRETLVELNAQTTPGEDVVQFSDQARITLRHFLLTKAAELNDTPSDTNHNDSVVTYAHKGPDNQDRIRYKPFTITRLRNTIIKIQAGTIEVRLPTQNNHPDSFLTAIQTEFRELETNPSETTEQQFEINNFKNNTVFGLMLSCETDPNKHSLYHESFRYASEKLQDFDPDFTGNCAELIYIPAKNTYSFHSVTKRLDKNGRPVVETYKSSLNSKAVPTIQELYLLMELLHYYSRF